MRGQVTYERVSTNAVLREWKWINNDERAADVRETRYAAFERECARFMECCVERLYAFGVTKVATTTTTMSDVRAGGRSRTSTDDGTREVNEGRRRAVNLFTQLGDSARGR